MKKRRILSAFLILSLVCLSCSSTGKLRTPPDIRFVEMSLSKEIEVGTYRAVPGSPSSTFSPEDPEVVAFVKLVNFWGVHVLRWDWFEPNGTLYYSTGDYPVKAAEGKYLREVTTWHRLSIRGEEAGKLPGEWTVKIFFDERVLAWKNFRIE